VPVPRPFGEVLSTFEVLAVGKSVPTQVPDGWMFSRGEGAFHWLLVNNEEAQYRELNAPI